jgi:hypothetical protein
MHNSQFKTSAGTTIQNYGCKSRDVFKLKINLVKVGRMRRERDP